MCTRYSLISPIECLRTRYGFEGGHAYPPRYNIAPTQPVAIIRLAPGREGEGRRELALVRWGLLPGWVKDPRTFATLVTARAETVLEKPSFRNAMKHRRCLVPADGYFDWTGDKGRRQPWYVSPSAADGPLALAALAEHWMGADGSEVETMAVVTVPASGALALRFDRMPAILSADDAVAWLDVRGTDPETAHAALERIDASGLDVRAVDQKANNPANDSADVIAPLGAPPD
jgi:putative SOS response-associated peptidase YedK